MAKPYRHDHVIRYILDNPCLLRPPTNGAGGQARPGPRRFVARADSGNEIVRSFCGDCGTPLYVQVATRPDVVGLRVCTLDDPGWFRPDADIFVKSAQPWEPIDAAVPQCLDYPPGKSYPMATGS